MMRLPKSERGPWWHGLAVVAVLILGLTSASRAAADEPAKDPAKNPVVVFAAASLKNALDDIAAQWQTDSGGTAAISYAGSSALAQQIHQGAPASIFISANTEWMDFLAEKKSACARHAA